MFLTSRDLLWSLFLKCTISFISLPCWWPWTISPLFGKMKTCCTLPNQMFSHLRGKHTEARKCVTVLCQARAGIQSLSCSLSGPASLRLQKLPFVLVSIWCWWICFHILLDSSGVPLVCGLVNHRKAFSDISTIVSPEGKWDGLSKLRGKPSHFCFWGNQTCSRLVIDWVLTGPSSGTLLSDTCPQHGHLWARAVSADS